MAHLNLVEFEPTPPDPDVVALAREILERAESGHLRALAIVAEVPHGGFATAHEIGADGSLITLLGGASRLASRLNEAFGP